MICIIQNSIIYINLYVYIYIYILFAKGLTSQVNYQINKTLKSYTTNERSDWSGLSESDYLASVCQARRAPTQGEIVSEVRQRQYTRFSHLSVVHTLEGAGSRSQGRENMLFVMLSSN